MTEVDLEYRVYSAVRRAGKAMSLRQQMHTAEKQFNQQRQKFEKELGKLLNQIQGTIEGREPEVDADKTGQKTEP